MALELSGPALQALERSGRAASVHEDALSRPALNNSTEVVESTETTALGRTGFGRTIAVIDTGVQADHPFLAGRVVGELCFSSSGWCPGGSPGQS